MGTCAILTRTLGKTTPLNESFGGAILHVDVVLVKNASVAEDKYGLHLIRYGEPHDRYIQLIQHNGSKQLHLLRQLCILCSLVYIVSQFLESSRSFARSLYKLYTFISYIYD